MAPAPMPFAEWFDAQPTPGRWSLLCVAADDPLDTAERRTIDWPGGSVVDALKAHGMAGRWSVGPVLAIRGSVSTTERERVGLARYQRVEPATVDLSEHASRPQQQAPARAPAPVAAVASPLPRRKPRFVFGPGDNDSADPQPTEDAEVDRARRNAETAQHAAQQAEHEAARADAEARTAEARARARTFQQQAAAGGAAGDSSAVLAAMMQQQQQQFAALLQAQREDSARQLALVASLVERATAPVAAAASKGALESLQEQLGLVKAVREMFRDEQGDDAPPAAGGAASVIRDLREIVREVRPMLQPAEQAARPAPAPARMLPAQIAARMAPAPNGHTPAAANAAAKVWPGDDEATARVRRFVAVVVAEAQRESEPEAVADLLSESVGLLPRGVREAIDAEDATGARVVSVVLPFLEAENAATLAELAPFAAEWLDRFVLALHPSTDGAS